MVKQYQIDEAYFSGLREGFDPEVAEDLGIPMTPDTVERHIASAKQVDALIGQATLSQQVEIIDPMAQDRQEWVASMRLTHPSSEGAFQHATPEERQFATENMNHVRAQLTPPNPRA